jgi:DNA polymerase-3 subunit gamma/tau
MSEQIQAKDFVVTARKWRPQSFADVVGQQHISNTLKNAIKNNRVHHAYLFCGPRGVGKTTTARILSRAVNCLNPVDFEPCNECENCKNILNGQSMDVIEIDGASNNSVDDIRKLRENAKYAPSGSKYKMYIIDEVHMLSTSAFNALLKTLEEPPPHLMFVFATTEAHKVPATIISRCQKFDFRRMEIDSIVNRLKFIAENEGITADEESLITVAKKGDGSMRDSQSIFDQVVAFCGKDIRYKDMADALNLIDEDFYFRISDSILNHDLADMFEIAAGVVNRGYDLKEALHGLIEFFRNILTIKVTGETKLIETSEAYLQKYRETAGSYTKEDLIRFINFVTQAELNLKFAPQPKIKFEMTLVQLASMDSVSQISTLIAELQDLKAQLASGNMPVIAAEEKKKSNVISDNQEAAYTAKPVAISQMGTQEETPTIVSINDNSQKALESHWQEFLDKRCSAELAIAKQCKAKFYDGEVLLFSTQSFQKMVLESKKNELSNVATEFFGTPVKIMAGDENSVEKKSIADLVSALPKKAEIKEEISSIMEEKKEPANDRDEFAAALKRQEESAKFEDTSHKSEHSTIATTKEEIENLHPVERAIVEIFGAREVR